VQHDGQPSPPSVPTSVVENSSAQNAPIRAVNDFALRLPPLVQRGGDQAHLRIVGEQQKELRRVRNGVLEATEQVNVPHSPLGLLWYHTKRILIGPPLATESAERERLTKVKALAVLSSDAISSVAYATEAILFNLAGAGSGHLGLTLPISIWWAVKPRGRHAHSAEVDDFLLHPDKSFTTNADLPPGPVR
jgi:hypothetical protein